MDCSMALFAHVPAPGNLASCLDARNSLSCTYDAHIPACGPCLCPSHVPGGAAGHAGAAAWAQQAAGAPVQTQYQPAAS